MTRPPSCDLSNLSSMADASYCTIQWKVLRDVLHPAQQAVGYAAVQRKRQKDFYSKKMSKANMKGADNSLPIVVGPGGIPYLVDSHHTVMALDASGYHSVKVELHKLCDWSHLQPEPFYETMKASNLMMGTGRPSTNSNLNALPVPIDVATDIPATIPQLLDDPWRSFGAFVRKVKDDTGICPSDHKKCLRGYFRGCQDDGHTAAFFEFRWAYFMNQAYLKGCSSDDSNDSNDWGDTSDCLAFESAFQDVLPQTSRSILDQDLDVWQTAGKRLVPLCRGVVAQSYIIPEELGSPMGGEQLPGRVEGLSTPILDDDPDCAAPKCPKLSVPLQPTSSQTSPQALPTTSPIQSWAALFVVMAAVAVVFRLVTVRLANRQSLEYRLMPRKNSEDEIELAAAR